MIQQAGKEGQTLQNADWRREEQFILQFLHCDCSNPSSFSLLKGGNGAVHPERSAPFLLLLLFLSIHSYLSQSMTKVGGIIGVTTSISLSLSLSLYFYCSSSSFSRPQISWFEKGQSIPGHSHAMRVQKTRCSFHPSAASIIKHATSFLVPLIFRSSMQ